MHFVADFDQLIAKLMYQRLPSYFLCRRWGRNKNHIRVSSDVSPFYRVTKKKQHRRGGVAVGYARIYLNDKYESGGGPGDIGGGGLK